MCKLRHNYDHQVPFNNGIRFTTWTALPFTPWRDFNEAEPRSGFAPLHNPSIETAKNKRDGNGPISTLEAALNDEKDPWSGEAAADANRDAPCEAYHRSFESRADENENVIAREMKPAVKE